MKIYDETEVKSMLLFAIKLMHAQDAAMTNIALNTLGQNLEVWDETIDNSLSHPNYLEIVRNRFNKMSTEEYKTLKHNVNLVIRAHDDVEKETTWE